MSPEAYQLSQYSVKSDVWSIGMIFYEMLAGYQPFGETTYEVVLQTITSGLLFASLLNVSPFTRLLLERMFHFDPNQRADTT